MESSREHNPANGLPTHTGDPGAEALPSEPGTAQAAADGEQIARVDDGAAGAKTWTCRFCDTNVVVEETRCPVCQQSIYDSFGAREGDTVEVSTNEALQWSMVPGGGHFRVGQGLLGAAIGLLVIVALIVGVMMITSGRIPYGVGLMLIGLAAWLGSAHDAYRIAEGTPDEVLLKPRIVSVAAGVVFMLIVAAAVSARSAIPQ